MSSFWKYNNDDYACKCSKSVGRECKIWSDVNEKKLSKQFNKRKVSTSFNLLFQPLYFCRCVKHSSFSYNDFTRNMSKKYVGERIQNLGGLFKEKLWKSLIKKKQDQKWKPCHSCSKHKPLMFVLNMVLPLINIRYLK